MKSPGIKSYDNFNVLDLYKHRREVIHLFYDNYKPGKDNLDLISWLQSIYYTQDDSLFSKKYPHLKGRL